MLIWAGAKEALFRLPKLNWTASRLSTATYLKLNSMNLQELKEGTVHQNGIDDDENFAVTKRDKVGDEIFIVLKKVGDEDLIKLEPEL